MYMLTILTQMIMLFAMMAIGFGLYRKEVVDVPFCKKLSWLVVNIFNPLLAMYGILNGKGTISISELLSNMGLVILYFGIVILFGSLLIFILRPELKDHNVYHLMCTFANVGFMGIPVICSVFGTNCMIYIAMYVIIYNFLLYTYGILVAAQSKKQEAKEKISIKRAFNWGTISWLIAIVFFFIPVDIPEFVMKFLEYMGNATIPLSMIMIGTSIAQSNMKRMFQNGRMYLFVLIRMVVLPILLLMIMRHFIQNPILLGVFILELAMPVGSIVVLIAKENGADEELCTNGIVLSTLLSIVTIPLVCLFF